MLRQEIQRFQPGKCAPFWFYSHTKAQFPNDERIAVDQLIFSNLHVPTAKPFRTFFTDNQRLQAAEIIRTLFKLTVKQDLTEEEALSFTNWNTTEQLFQGMKIDNPVVRAGFLTNDMSGMNAAKLGQGRSRMPEGFLKHLQKVDGTLGEKYDPVALTEKFQFYMEGKKVYAGKVETVNRNGEPDVRYWFKRYCTNEQWHARESMLVMAAALWIKFVVSDCYKEEVAKLLAFNRKFPETPVLPVERTTNDFTWADGGDGKGSNKLGKMLALMFTTAFKWDEETGEEQTFEALRAGGCSFADYVKELDDELSSEEKKADPAGIFQFLNSPNVLSVGDVAPLI
eukprot:TRINITY_DN10903_c0_g1_i1.p1 TRINITY_DN10903_c0_g1~~TRINITY_DN10903_c0_g1_i1.p1  ORF type:complete len:340 (+),score=38.07 TRINITY_DN10903_c0_g1_i1:56-1075(+)